MELCPQREEVYFVLLQQAPPPTVRVIITPELQGSLQPVHK